MLEIDKNYLANTLISLLNIPSPTGYTDQIVHFVGKELQQMKVRFNVTRRGAIRATLPGTQDKCDRAIAVHLDTLGAMVTQLKDNGRLGISSIGTWAARFAEGSRVTIFNDQSPYRGSVLPLKASGHIFGDAAEQQPAGWDYIEIRVDDRCNTQADLVRAGFNIGDFVAFDAAPEITPNGFVNARHIDDKGGVAVLLSVIKEIAEKNIALPVDCHIFFTIAEEVGLGASAVLYCDVTEMIAIDHAPVGPGQNTSEFGVTIGMMDQAGPFDYHLTRKLIELCKSHEIEHTRDVFKFYRSDSASAIEAGNDTRTALIGFGVDASHGYERTHISSLFEVARLISLYMQSPPMFIRDKDTLATLNGFPHQPERDLIEIHT
jgi:peptidase M42 family hydrolase